MDNTRPVRTNTADRASYMPMTQGYVRVLVWTVCFQWNIHTHRVHYSEQQVETTGEKPQVTVPVETSTTTKNYELLKK